MSITAVRERAVERYLIDRCRTTRILCLKFVSPGVDGVPDRVLIAPARTLFAEVKRPGGRLRPLQRAVVARMRRHGADVRVIDSFETVDALIAELTEQIGEQS